MPTITYNMINIPFDRRVDKEFKNFSYMRENRYWPIVRNVRKVTIFKGRGNRAGFPNNRKNSFIEGMLKKKMEKISKGITTII